ncbi:hypothetical protein, partial [Halomonas nitroreducens]|uniref:hypothetical protein n=1 Tax=Halomonas nitroreducens TaxID=447425 RepID=UPI001C8C1800
MTAPQRLTLTRADARRLLVRYHFRPAPLATVIRRLGTIQFPICQRSCHLNGLRGDQHALPRRAEGSHPSEDGTSDEPDHP